MWIPRTEADLEQAVASGSLRETATFEAKSELPPPGKNRDLAKDICAMTVDGGVIVYGVGGSDPTRPDELTPVSLRGAAERIDQVVQTAISEPPTISLHEIRTSGDDGTGYIAVAVAPSPRAPHMVTLEGDNRFYGRGEAGNRKLTEGEIARLYRRREEWELDRDAWLNKAISAMPFAFDEPVSHIGPMLAIVRPVSGPRDLLRRAAALETVDDFLVQRLLSEGRRVDPYPDQGSAGLGEAFNVTRHGADVWLLRRDVDAGATYQAYVRLSVTGEMEYWHCPTFWTETLPNGSVTTRVLERSVTRAVYQCLTVAAWLQRMANYVGPSDVGIGVLGLSNAYGSTIQHAFTPPRFGAADYRRHDRVTAAELRDDPRKVTRRLIDPLFDVISKPGYDPFADR